MYREQPSRNQTPIAILAVLVVGTVTRHPKILPRNPTPAVLDLTIFFLSWAKMDGRP